VPGETTQATKLFTAAVTYMMIPIIEFWLWEWDATLGQSIQVERTGMLLHFYESGDVCVMDSETKVLHKVELTPEKTKVLGFRQSMEIFDGQP